MRSTHVLEQLPWITIFLVERDVESLGCLYHSSIEYISFDLLTAQGTIRQWSDEQWEALVERCPNLKCVAWMDDLFLIPSCQPTNFRGSTGASKLSTQWLKREFFQRHRQCQDNGWSSCLCGGDFLFVFGFIVDRSFLLSIYFRLHRIN